MSQEGRCLKESHLSDMRADIAGMNKDCKSFKRRLGTLESKADNLADLNVAINVMSLSLEHIVLHNETQDNLVGRQAETLEKINENLNHLNQGQNSLERKVESLESRVDDNESLHMIDIREVEKIKQENYLKRYAIPMSFGAAIGALIIELIKVLK